jgi:hypothetical protein
LVSLADLPETRLHSDAMMDRGFKGTFSAIPVPGAEPAMLELGVEARSDQSSRDRRMMP